MSAASNSATVSPEEVGLALDPRGTRFRVEAAESAFRAWRFERSRRGLRVSLLASAAVWIGLLPLVVLVRPAGAVPWALGIGLMLVVLVVVWAAQRSGASRAAEWSLLLSMVASGVLGIGISNMHFESHAMGLAAAVFTSFYQFQASNDRPAHLGIAVATSVLTEGGAIAAEVAAGRIGAGVASGEVFLLVATYGLGLLGAIATAASTRRSYRQQRIIEAQKVTIAKERARSEALLKQELSHQVAERSRELGNVLARSDVTLDVRRLSPGERFDARYRIVSAVGAGGMGAVYEVERLTDGATLALKAVVGEVSGASAARFAREAEIGARIHHPNLVSIVDVGVSAGVPFLVMELVRGGSLESQRGRFGDVAWALPILRQIAEGLAALHDAGVVHRDLKPANVLLAGEGAATVAKISDFGISRFGALDDAASSIDPNAATVGPSSPRPSALTGTGMVMGTPLYMAPEAARGGRAVDAPADVFALGIMAYEMLTGRAPFAVPAVMLAMAEQPIPAPPPIDDARVPAALRTLVVECLTSDPTRRPRVRRLLAELGLESG